MNRKAYVSILAFVFLAFVFLTGCNNSSSKPPVETMTLQSGSPQSTAGGTAFAAPLVAQVTTGGTPTSGVSVTFTAPSSGASGTFANGTATETDTTDINGLATSSQFTANTTTGAYTVAATASGLPTVNFSLTNTAVPATITATSGGGQSAFVLTAFTNPLVATVLDVNSSPVSGVAVVFTAPALTGASGTFANGTNTETDTTDVNGNATSSTFTANAIVGGPYNVTAAVTAPALSTTFAETNTVGGTAVGITATGGVTQSAVISTAFALPLVANVTVGGVPTAGLSVTFTAPATGASGTFASNGTATETDTTDVNGNATSSTFTANATVGGPYVVAATVTGAAAPANFNLTNTAAPTSFTYAFYLTGREAANGGPNFYALAGAVTVGADGTVTAGEQDYNDGFGLTSPQPAGDTITGGTLTVSTTVPGQATLTLITNNTALGVAGTETLGVQFVNANHALIVQFDGSATSSGSLDLQTATSGSNGGYAFTLSGVDTSYAPVVYGGVFSISTGTAVAGVYDEDDAGTVTSDAAFTGTASVPDAFGRGTVTGTDFGGYLTTLNYYIVGPEVMRIIDVDTSDSGVGSAFGQGTGTFSNLSLGNSVFGISANSFGNPYAAAGAITTSGNGSFTGIADDDEPFGAGVVTDSSVVGVYSIGSNGYGTMTINNLGSIVSLGIYATDPTLNLNDPNNSSGQAGATLAGALVTDLDGSLNGTGVLIPQTDNTDADFTGNYAFGAQDYWLDVDSAEWEFDFVGQGSVTADVLAGTGLVSDPFTFFTGDPTTDTGVTFAGTATPDGVTAGRYTIPLAVTPVDTTPATLNAVIYQVSGGQLFWVGADAADVFLGSLEQQGSLTGLPAVKKAGAKANQHRSRTK